MAARRVFARSGTTSFVVALFLGAASGFAQPYTPETAALSPSELNYENEAALPRVLTEADIRRYHRIGAAQGEKRWADADHDIKALTDPILVGHMLADRYLHPSYKSSYDELKSWLEQYADHPDAYRIWRLALARKPAKAKAPHPPTYVAQPPAADSAEARRGAATSRKAQDFMSKVRLEALDGRPDLAAQMLDGDEAAQLLDTAELDATRGYVASRFFYAGDVPEAHALAAESAKRSGAKSPATLWMAGLAAYRLGKYREAAGHFEAMAALTKLGDWTAAAAAFWAARANLVGQRPERVHHWLAEATRYPYTFYGQLAHRLLGTKPDYRFVQQKLTTRQITMLMREEPARRAFALLQMNEQRRAELELRPLGYRGNTQTNIALIALAERVGMPALALRVALVDKNPETGETRHPGALYPIPTWKPTRGFVIDKALVYAFMRQESAFNVRATSPVGARGLMQLMPGTASMMARERLRGEKTESLYDPAYNIDLGQKYLAYLLEHETVQGDLFRLAAAYNGGPGNLAKWDRRTDKMSDPLMFIESIPAHETRNFIERVLANLWIYRLRLGQDSDSLDAIASGERPVYEALDAKAAKLAANGRN